MTQLESLIARMKATASSTCDKIEEALGKIKALQPRMEDTLTLLNAAEKNGLSIREWRRRVSEMFDLTLSSCPDCLVFKTDARPGDMRDDKVYYIADGHVCISRDFYLKITKGKPNEEDKNIRVLRRLNKLIEVYESFEKNVFADIKKQIEIKEGK